MSTSTGADAGGVKPTRTGVWRVDVEVPRGTGEPRRRVSRTVVGSEADAEPALDSAARGLKGGPRTRRAGARAAGVAGDEARVRGVTRLGHDRWLVGLEGDADPVSGDRRRHTKVVWGSREEAEAEWPTEIASGGGELGAAPRPGRSRGVPLYLDQAGTERSTVRIDRSACNRSVTRSWPAAARWDGYSSGPRLEARVVRVLGVGRTLKPRPSARYASTLSKVLEHAKREGWMSANPVREARKPKVPIASPRRAERAEVAGARHGSIDRLATYAYVLGVASTGCRRSELLALRSAISIWGGWSRFVRSMADGGPGVGIYVKATKRDDWRDVSVTDQMVEGFEELLDGAGRAERVGATRRTSRVRVQRRSRRLRPGCGRTRRRQRWLAARGDEHGHVRDASPLRGHELLDVTERRLPHCRVDHRQQRGDAPTLVRRRPEPSRRRQCSAGRSYSRRQLLSRLRGPATPLRENDAATEPYAGEFARLHAGVGVRSGDSE